MFDPASASPDNNAVNSIFNLFNGQGLSKMTPLQTPTQPRTQAVAARSPRQQPQTVINLFTQPVSCSNFYSCSDSQCQRNPGKASNGSFSMTTSPVPNKLSI